MSWIDDIIVKLSGGHFSIAGLLNVSAGSIVTEKDKFITSKGVTKVIQVTQMPYHYTEELITVITRYVGKIDSSIIVNSYIEADRCTIPINHPTFVAKSNKALQKYVEVDELFNGLGKIHRKAGVFKHNGVSLKSFTIDDVKNAKHTAESYTEVRNNIKRNGGVYFLTRLFFHFTFPNHTLANQHYEGIFNFVTSTVLKAERMNKKMGTYLLNMSPSVTNIQGISSANILTSEQSLTNLIPYRTQGLISTKGALLGTDAVKKAPFFLDPYSTDEGSSTLIVGGAGSGKTVFAYHFSLQSIPNDTTVVYLDLKGGTVSKALSELMDNYITINFSGKHAKFINPLILDVVNKNYGMKEAVQTTASWLALMVGLTPDEGNERDLDILLKAAIKGYYTEVGVSEDNPSTYYKSHNMELGRLVEFLGVNKNQTTDAQEIKLYEIAAKRISALIQEHHMERNDNAIDVTTLYDYDAIIFDFDKDTEVTIDSVDVIRIFSVMFFTKQLSGFNKANERYTALFADEGNQYLGIKGLMEYISDLTARARSSNASVVFITNDLSVVARPEMSGFRSNIAVYIVGKVEESDLNQLSNLCPSTELRRLTKTINKYPGKFKHSFAVHSTLNGHPVDAIVRADLPKNVVKAFASRTVKTEAY